MHYLYLKVNIYTNIIHCYYRQSSKSLTLAEDDDFYHDNPKLPIYSRTSVRLDTHNIVNAVLDPELKEDKVCSMQPIDVENNAVFIVDLGKLGTLKDLYCDDMGSWQYNGVYRTWLEVDDAGYVATLGKQKPSHQLCCPRAAMLLLGLRPRSNIAPLCNITDVNRLPVY